MGRLPATGLDFGAGAKLMSNVCCSMSTCASHYQQHGRTWYGRTQLERCAERGVVSVEGLDVSRRLLVRLSPVNLMFCSVGVLVDVKVSSARMSLHGAKEEERAQVSHPHSSLYLPSPTRSLALHRRTFLCLASYYWRFCVPYASVEKFI